MLEPPSTGANASRRHGCVCPSARRAQGAGRWTTTWQRGSCCRTPRARRATVRRRRVRCGSGIEKSSAPAPELPSSPTSACRTRTAVRHAADSCIARLRRGLVPAIALSAYTRGEDQECGTEAGFPRSSPSPRPRSSCSRGAMGFFAARLLSPARLRPGPGLRERVSEGTARTGRMNDSADRRGWLAYAALAAAIAGMSWSALFVRWADVPARPRRSIGCSSRRRYSLPVACVRGARRPQNGARSRSRSPAALSSPSTSCSSTAPSCGRRLPRRCSSATTPRSSSAWVPGFSSETSARDVLAGLALALAGCAFIVFADASQRVPRMPGTVTGDLLALSAAVFWAAYMVTTEHVRTAMDTLTFNTVAIAGSVLTVSGVPGAGGAVLGVLGENVGRALRARVHLALAASYALVYALGTPSRDRDVGGVLAQVPLAALLAAALLREPLSTLQTRRRPGRPRQGSTWSR